MDLNRFQGPKYEELFRSYFREKYAEKPISIIISLGSTALEYALRSSAERGNEIPIVFAVVEDDVQVLSKPNLTGTMSGLDLHDMATAARALVPGLKQLVLVGDPYERQPSRRHFRRQSAEIASEFQVTDLTGLPIREVKRRVAALPPEAAILYTSIFVDGDGVNYIPREALAMVAEAASRPIVIDAETQFGYGGTGGFVLNPNTVGEAAAAQALRILAGESASDIPVLRANFRKPVFDWRELKRWNISEDRLPPGSEVRFRPQSMWEQYRWQMAAIAAVLLLQGVMIAALMIERHRRHAAEVVSRRHLLEVLHLNRGAIAGVLSSSFAHELTQPLATILSNAEAAELYLENDPPDINGVKAILVDIRREDQRAADIINHLRGLLSRKNEVELKELDVNEAVRGALYFLEPEARRKGIAFSAIQAPCALPVRANPVHLQQVILNVAANGMDAMADGEPGKGKLILQTKLTDASEVEVSVADTGSGIPDGNLQDVFKPFFTTKPEGTGLGLSIAHSIMEIYGGRIWAENGPEGGTVFRFSMPLAKVQSP
jgi:signal transduction histidine kinase